MTVADVMQSGHAVGDADGIILAADASVCELLHRPAHTLIGRSYQEITHPDDRESNAHLLAALPVGDAPIVIRKRYLRADGSAVPVELSVSRFSEGERAGRLVGTVRWWTAATVNANALWRTAQDIEALSHLRRKLLGADLFPDYPMTMLLRIYIAELEGRTITLDGLADELDLSPQLTTRWLAALTSYGLLDPPHHRAAMRQLSDAGVARLEHLLRAAGHAAAGFVGGMADSGPR